MYYRRLIDVPKQNTYPLTRIDACCDCLFPGLAGYYSCAKGSYPFTNLMKVDKAFVWSEHQQPSFDALKDVTAPTWRRASCMPAKPYCTRKEIYNMVYFMKHFRFQRLLVATAVAEC